MHFFQWAAPDSVVSWVGESVGIVFFLAIVGFILAAMFMGMRQGMRDSKRKERMRELGIDSSKVLEKNLPDWWEMDPELLTDSQKAFKAGRESVTGPVAKSAKPVVAKKELVASEQRDQENLTILKADLETKLYCLKQAERLFKREPTIQHQATRDTWIEQVKTARDAINLWYQEHEEGLPF